MRVCVCVCVCVTVCSCPSLVVFREVSMARFCSARSSAGCSFTSAARNGLVLVGDDTT